MYQKNDNWQIIVEGWKEHSFKQTETDKQQNWNELVEQILWLIQGQMQANIL